LFNVGRGVVSTLVVIGNAVYDFIHFWVLLHFRVFDFGVAKTVAKQFQLSTHELSPVMVGTFLCGVLEFYASLRTLTTNVRTVPRLAKIPRLIDEGAIIRRMYLLRLSEPFCSCS